MLTRASAVRSLSIDPPVACCPLQMAAWPTGRSPGKVAPTAPRCGRGAQPLWPLSVLAEQPSLRRLQLSIGEDAALMEADQALQLLK